MSIRCSDSRQLRKKKNTRFPLHVQQFITWNVIKIRFRVLVRVFCILRTLGIASIYIVFCVAWIPALLKWNRGVVSVRFFFHARIKCRWLCADRRCLYIYNLFQYIRSLNTPFCVRLSHTPTQKRNKHIHVDDR